MVQLFHVAENNGLLPAQGWGQFRIGIGHFGHVVADAVLEVIDISEKSQSVEKD